MRHRPPMHFIACIALALVVSACAAPDKVGVKDEKRLAEVVPPAPSGQHIAFGKLNLVRDGKPAKIKKLRTFSVSGMAALVLPEDSRTALTLDVDEQGWFAWPLKPGTYTVLGFLTLQGNSTQFEDINGHFHVGASEPLVYIGHLNLQSSGSQFNVSLQDAESDAFEEIRKKYLEAQAPVKRLLEPASRSAATSMALGVRF